MNRYEEWNEFLENLFSSTLKQYNNSREYEYQKLWQKQLDEFLEKNLTAKQKQLVEEILLEIFLAAENESKTYYQQGIKDGIWLLKNMEVLA